MTPGEDYNEFRTRMKEMSDEMVLHLLQVEARGTGLYSKVLRWKVTRAKAAEWLTTAHEALDGLAPLEVIHDNKAWLILPLIEVED